jgi:queuine tRNA-ribosyltransferase
MLGGMLLSLHNIYFYQSLMADIRKSIEEDRFMSFSKEFLESYKS